MAKTISIGMKRQVNELDLYFWSRNRCEKGNSNQIILSKVIVSSDNRQTDRHFVKTIFSDSGGLETSRNEENLIGSKSHKTNTFHLYDENVKIQIFPPKYGCY